MPEMMMVGDRPIAVERRTGRAPGLFWLSGFRSDMAGTKASATDAFGASHALAVTRFDYSGHGQSGGDFNAGTIGRWLGEAEAVFATTAGPQIVIGSSMGGWIALLLNRVLRQEGIGRVAAAFCRSFSARKSLLAIYTSPRTSNDCRRPFSQFWGISLMVRILAVTFSPSAPSPRVAALPAVRSRSGSTWRGHRSLARRKRRSIVVRQPPGNGRRPRRNPDVLLRNVVERQHRSRMVTARKVTEGAAPIRRDGLSARTSSGNRASIASLRARAHRIRRRNLGASLP